MSRFERKIVTALAAVALVPLVAALILGRGALREVYEVGVRPVVRGELERALEVYRAYFVTLRERAELTADTVANHWQLRDRIAAKDAASAGRVLGDLLERYPHLAAVSVRTGARSVPAFVKVQRPERLRPDMRQLRLTRSVPDQKQDVVLDITVAAPLQRFDDYQRAGQLVEVFSRLQSGTGRLSNFYLLVYSGFLLSVILLALVVGVTTCRRVTRRISVLAEATARVGAGDLTVEVPADAKDEIGELTRAFNTMVHDLSLSRARIEYLQRINEWQQFARRLAHEIKNPLTPIQLATQEIHRSYTGEDDAFRQRLDEAVSIVQEEVATLRRLVSEFSAFARLPEADLAAADLNRFVREGEKSLRAMLDGSFSSSEIQFRCELNPSPLPVRIDAMMLMRCVDNLVRNAAQTIAQSGRPPGAGMIVLRTRRAEAWALLEVLDNGPGVPEANRPKIFEPYYTTRQDGTGLGLAIVKKVVLEHGAEVSCMGREGALGTCFQIRLPRSPSTDT